jgi:N-acetylneuraminate synthase
VVEANESRFAAARAAGRCFVIAEAGSNHCGRLEIARRLVDVAAEAGADAVKFQLFTSAKLYAAGAGVADYLGTETAIEEIIRDVELPQEWVPVLAADARSRRIDFVAAPFHEDAVDVLAPYVSVIKIASYELTHEPLIRRAAATGKPLLLSTGAATLAEAAAGLSAARSGGATDVTMLQCTASYPAPASSLNLGAMAQLRDELGVPVGLSDHSSDPLVAPVAAIALGATVLEKHFTLGKELPGPDHRFALDPAELRAMVAAVRAAEAALGSGRKEVQPEEEELRAFARRSVFAVRDINAGETIDEGAIAVLRTGKLAPGLPPSEYAAVLGRRASRPIPANTALAASDVE